MLSLCQGFCLSSQVHLPLASQFSSCDGEQEFERFVQPFSFEADAVDGALSVLLFHHAFVRMFPDATNQGYYQWYNVTTANPVVGCVRHEQAIGIDRLGFSINCL